jgi:hypothetical protein
MRRCSHVPLECWPDSQQLARAAAPFRAVLFKLSLIYITLLVRRFSVDEGSTSSPAPRGEEFRWQAIPLSKT